LSEWKEKKEGRHWKKITDNVEEDMEVKGIRN